MGMSVVDLARTLRRDERTVRDWLSGKQRMPCWVPEYMRLRQMEQADIPRQMNMTALGPRLGIVCAATSSNWPCAGQKRVENH